MRPGLQTEEAGSPGLHDELIAFDCIEFDPALRWIDVMSDVAFLTMDLKAQVLERQLASYEPLDSAERVDALEVFTDEPADVASLCQRWLARA